MLYPDVSSSDVAVELPFTLMHPKPREEPVHRDSECLPLSDRGSVPEGGWVGAKGASEAAWREILAPIDPVRRASVLKSWGCSHHPSVAKLPGGVASTHWRW